MTINYWTNFSKRINSTKRPTGAGTSVTMALKNNCSIENPIFEVKTIPTTCNYIKWGNNYYYVTEIEHLTNDNIRIHCDIDVLATFKSNILATKAFVEYSESAYDANILDPRISNKYPTTQKTATASLSGLTSAQGTYMLTCVSDKGVAIVYACSKLTMDGIGNYISTQMTDTVAETFVKKYGSVYNCILGCKWVPFDYTKTGEHVYLGAVDTGLDCGYVAVPFNYSTELTISIPWIHTATDDVCRRENETIELFLPGYGSINISPSAINYSSTLKIQPYYDRTGGLTYKVENSDGKFKALYNCNVGVDIAVTQFTQSPLGMLLSNASENLTWAGNHMQHRPGSVLTGRAYSFIADIYGRLVNVGSRVSSIGGNGGGSAAADLHYNPNIIITNTSYSYCESQPNMADRYGRPLMAVRTLSTFTGYVKTNGASVDIPGFEDEKDKVNGFLNGGIFIE